MPPEWNHVCDLSTLQRDRNSEIRLRLVEGRKGYAVEIRKHDMSHHHDGMNAAGPGLLVFSDRIPELISALERGHSAASALRQAGRV